MKLFRQQKKTKKKKHLSAQQKTKQTVWGVFFQNVGKKTRKGTRSTCHRYLKQCKTTQNDDNCSRKAGGEGA